MRSASGVALTPAGAASTGELLAVQLLLTFRLPQALVLQVLLAALPIGHRQVR
jgi:hypothetical protein